MCILLGTHFFCKIYNLSQDHSIPAKDKNRTKPLPLLTRKTVLFFTKRIVNSKDKKAI